MKSFKFFVLCLVWFLFILYPLGNFIHAEKESVIIIENVTLIDGTGRPPVSKAFVLIRGNRIVKVDDDPIKIPKGARRINGKGKYLIPGLGDMHIHLRGGRSKEPDESVGIRGLHSYIYCGITSVYDAGNNGDFIMGLREKERSGQIVSTRIFATGPACSYPGSHGSGPSSVLVDDWPEDIPKLDKHIAMKPDIAKLMYDQHTYNQGPMIPQFPVDLLQEVIRYYNYHGIRTTCHIPDEPHALEAIYAGIDTLAHHVMTSPITDNFAKLMAAKKIPMVSTMTIVEWPSRLAEHPEYLDQPLYKAVLDPEEIKRLKTEERAKRQKSRATWWKKLVIPVNQENIRKINEAGGIVALGSDQGIGPQTHRELELLVEGGISTLDAIRIGTLNTAIFLGKEREMGSIEEGKLADMVLLNADPIADIDNAKNIHMVIKDGKIIDRSKLNLPINQKSGSK